MAKFRFRLQPLLDSLLDKKEQAAKALAERRKELLAEQQLLEEMKLRVQELTAKREDLRRRVLETAPGEPLTGSVIQRRRDYLEVLKQDLDTARDGVFSQKLAVDEAEERVAHAQAALLQAQRDVEVLNKYRERLEQRHRREIERKEELDQDEIGSMLFMTRRRTS
jgi:flagellar export protein FliJ